MSEAKEARADHLQQLNNAVAELITRPAIVSTIDRLKNELPHSEEPFVWSTIDLESITTPLPDDIKSGWIFVLKKDVGSGCHYHPNSIQHMVMTEGEGTSKVGAISRKMNRFDEQGHALDETWYVIPEGVPHEFFPAAQDVVVFSFHTCHANELEEVSCDSGAVRNYESV